MKCIVCNNECEVLTHTFFKGTQDRPERFWTVVAPLYYKSNNENTECIEPYCSCKCSFEKYNLDQGIISND